MDLIPVRDIAMSMSYGRKKIKFYQKIQTTENPREIQWQCSKQMLAQIGHIKR